MSTLQEKTDKVLLGYTVPPGEPFFIPVAHTIITGMTQFGKTTTEEAIIDRLPGRGGSILKAYKALVFLTKRGEKVFTHGQHFLKPFYRERFDWEYVRGLLEAAWKEKMRFETPWIIRICKGATSLTDVRQRLASVLTREKLRDFDRNIYTTLAAYMDKVLPVLEQAKNKFIDTLDLTPGLNVMDLTEWYTNEEVQMLVIRSCMEHILKSENNVIVGLPEAWKMLPQNRNTPVKLFFEKFIREGATNGCYLFIDAQDLGGVDKTPLRQVSVWIMGHMQEANEVERLLKQTLGVDVPAREIQTLPLGHFIVATGEEVTKVYVRPIGISEEHAQLVARGKLSPETVKERLVWSQEHPGYPKECQECTRYNTDTRCANCSTEERHRLLQQMNPLPLLQIGDTRYEALEKRVDALSRKVDNLQMRLLSQDMSNENTSVNGHAQLTQKSLTVSVEKAVVEFTLTTANVAGKIMWLAKEGFLDAWKTQKEIEDALTTRGWGAIRITVYKALESLVSQGFIGTRKTDRAEFKLAPFVTFKEGAT